MAETRRSTGEAQARFGRIIACLMAAVLAVVGLAACSSATTDTPPVGPRAWIDFPREGATVPVGASVVVVSHADAADGISEVLLSVNGGAFRRDPSAAPGDTLVEFRQEWVPSAPGPTTLEVRAYTADGGASGSDRITVVVEGPAPLASESTPTPTPMPTPASPTPASPTTPAPRAEPTTAPIPAPTTPAPRPTTRTTPTPEAPVAPPPTSPPPAVPPPDTIPPPVPTPAVPADGLVSPCRSSQTLAWLPVTDPSGVTYAVKLEQQMTSKTWESVRIAGMIAAKQYDVPVQCGGIYRWAVLARDNAGNSSEWSAYSRFSVDLG